MEPLSEVPVREDMTDEQAEIVSIDVLFKDGSKELFETAEWNGIGLQEVQDTITNLHGDDTEHVKCLVAYDYYGMEVGRRSARQFFEMGEVF